MIVGNSGGTNVGQSLLRAAAELGRMATLRNATEAFTGPVWLRRAAWRLAGHRAPRMGAFSRSLVDTPRNSRPRAVITTGMVPLHGWAIEEARKGGAACLHYSTDDPWNPVHRAGWFLRTLPIYDHIFSTRRSNLGDFRSLGCRRVSYLPFGYDPELFFPEHPAIDEIEGLGCDVLFVGGADDDRVPVLSGLVDAGLRVALYGDYWDRYPRLRSSHRGRADASLLRRATLAASINLCLCRRANRDGHVMRTFEIPAVGGFMLAEDTPEHRELFGAEGECVDYFRGLGELVDKARRMLDLPNERKAMARAARQRILSGGHTYADRLRTILSNSAGAGEG